MQHQPVSDGGKGGDGGRDPPWKPLQRDREKARADVDRLPQRLIGRVLIHPSSLIPHPFKMKVMVPTLSVIIPCYNERATVAELLRRVKEVPVDKEIIVIDDKSTDGSRSATSCSPSTREKALPSAAASKRRAATSC